VDNVCTHQANAQLSSWLFQGIMVVAGPKLFYAVFAGAVVATFVHAPAAFAKSPGQRGDQTQVFPSERSINYFIGHTPGLAQGCGPRSGEFSPVL
jgi:hypothetical protein